MHFKLAVRNVFKSFRDYTVYFLTLMLGVCIFYTFNSIESQQTMMNLTESQNRIIKNLVFLIGYVSIFISVILGFLIVYANNFLIKRRKKELGIYQTLGMRKGQIARILILETFIVAIVSLTLGLLIGIFLSQGFAIITTRLIFEVKVERFMFIFSSSAALKTVLYFGIAFVCVMLWSSFEVGRQKLIDLLYADRKNEKFKTPHLVLSVFLFIVSVACLGWAYNLIIKNGLHELDAKFYQSIVFGIIGTFLFFFSLSGFFLKIIQQNKTIYLKKLNMFVLRQLNSKINTTYLSMSMVCLMLFLCIGALSTGTGMSKAISTNLKRFTPFDGHYEFMFFENIRDNEGNIIQTEYIDLDIEKYFQETSIPISDYAKDFNLTKIYKSDALIELQQGLVHDEDSFEPSIIKLSDFNKILEMQGIEPLTLKEDEFYINYNFKPLKRYYLNLDSQFRLSVLGKTLKFAGALEHVIQNQYDGADLGTLVVYDELLDDNTNVVKTLVTANYPQSTPKYEKLFVEACKEVLQLIKSDYSSALKTSTLTRISIIENSKSSSIMITYLGMYIGIVFLMISSAVLAITQLSEAADNAKRYNLLFKLGVDDAMISKALFTQIAIYFLTPLILAVCHSIIGIYVVNNVISAVTQTNILSDSLFTSVVLVIVYGCYFLATYFGSKRLIHFS